MPRSPLHSLQQAERRRASWPAPARLLHVLIAIAFALTVVLRADVAAAFVPPPMEDHVTDTAGKLSRADDAELEAKLSAIERRTGNEIAVLVVGSLDGETIEDVAYETFNAWKLGKKGADNGVLLVWAPTERRLRIETGKGVGGALTDIQSSRIINETMAPLLRQDRYKDAIAAGCDAIATALAGGGVASDPGAQPRRVNPGQVILWSIVILIILMSIGRRFRGGGGGGGGGFWIGGGGFGGGGGDWGGGGGGWGGGGGFSGGGGSSGGGGASGGY